jgi:Na+-translocating ferredoxin:NAD+ oxidoreductase subunit G
MSESIFTHAIKTAVSMISFALVGTFMLATIYQITREPISKNEAEARLALFEQVLPESSYDNDILNTQISVEPNALLGNQSKSVANIALLKHQPVAIILEAIARDGYAGDIKLLIAIRMDGSISGVRVISHKETPGLGDYIDILRNDWISLFSNESLAKTIEKQWKVKKDGGKFDYMVGATITPRAVIKKVKETLLYFQAEKQTILKLIKESESQKSNSESVQEHSIVEHANKE